MTKNTTFGPQTILAFSLMAVANAGCSSNDATSPTGDAGTTADAGTTTDSAAIADSATAVDGGAPADSGLPTDSARADAQATDGGARPLEIEGTWSSNFGGYEEISLAAWNDSAVVAHDAATRVLYTQNAAAAQYSPNKFNKIVWLPVTNDAFYYCFVDYGLDTLAAAQASTKTVDPSSPSTTGCGGFSWTKLAKVAPLEIAGTWTSNFGGTETLSSRRWASASMQKFDNAANVAYSQNPSDAQYSPSKFNKLVWTEPTAGSFYYCTIEFGLDSLAAAIASTKTADATSPATTGCGGFSWTKLTRP